MNSNTVFVVMSNDSPESVWSDEAKADAYVKAKNEADKAEFPHRRIFWRTYNFDLDARATRKRPTSVAASEIEAMVSDNGDGDKVTLVVPPELRQWQHFAISVDDARLLSAKLTRAANLAEKNVKSDEMDF